MISFLIPVFNYNCTELVRGLSEQAVAVKRQENPRFDFEIVVTDDASTNETLKSTNRLALSQIAGCRYIELKKNMGRAAIRNFLTRQASFEFLVFIDCDAEICSKDFVLSYWNDRDKADIICGSLKTPASPPPRDVNCAIPTRKLPTRAGPSHTARRTPSGVSRLSTL